MSGDGHIDSLRALYGAPRESGRAGFRADDRIEHLRIPPQAIASEQFVIGALMLAPDSWHSVCDVLDASDFYRRDHQLIWRAIGELAEKRKPYDAVMLGEWFESHGMSELVSGGAYLIELSCTQATAANIVAHADVVREKALLRQLIEAGTEAVNAGFQPEGRDLSEIVGGLQAQLTDLQPRQRGGLTPASASLGAWYEDLVRRYESGDRMTGMPTPWHDLNEATHGLQAGELVLLGARPSMGKSVMGLNLALFSALRGKRVAMFSLEMSRVQCNRRNIASLGQIPHDWLLSPAGADQEYWPQVTAALQQIKPAPLWIDDTPDLTIRQIQARARRQHREQPIDLLIVDHLHEIRINAKEARFEIGQAAQGIKTLAREFNCPAVALCQLNRNIAGRSDKRPTLTDLRESGELEAKGDLILFLHREDYYDSPDQQTHLQGVVECHIAKGRDIEAGKRIHLRNRYAQMRLDDWEGSLPSKPFSDDQPSRRRSAGFNSRWQPYGNDEK